MDPNDTRQTTPPFPTSGAHASEHPAGRTGNGQASANLGDDMLERIVQVAHEAIDRLAGSAAPHVHQIQDQLEQVGETFNMKASDMRATGDEWAENLRGTVREHPLATMAAGVALGLLIARLTR